MNPAPSRRQLLLLTAATVTRAAPPPTTVPSEMRRFRDPATEFDLIRLTDPEKSNCWMPRAPLRAIANRNNAFLYCSDRSGSVQAWRMDLKTGESRLLTAAQDLHWQTVTWTADEKRIAYFDGPELRIGADQKVRTLYAAESGWTATPVFTLADDGEQAAVVERREGRHRLRVIDTSRRAANTIFEADEPVRLVRFSPRRGALAYNHGGALWLAMPGGRGAQRLKTAEGEAGEAQWSADGRLLHYLLTPAGQTATIQMREVVIETGEDRLVGPTTQFSSFARNADSAVFAGVSRSKASPYVLLLLRAMRRELTVAEHKASDPSKAAVIFAPNSQRLYYETDREGKSAIYTMPLERFLEKTETSAAVRPSPFGRPMA